MSTKINMSTSSYCTELIIRQNAKMFLRQTGSNRNPLNRFRRTPFVKIRCVFDQIAPNFIASSSLNSIVTPANLIAAAAAGTSTAHAAVGSAIAHVAVTAMAIASGACLSTKVDFLWPKLEEQPDALVLDGVDVTGYPIFNDEKVQKAIAFARKAHHGQLRKTGDAYITHCIHTGKILAALVPSTGRRAIDTVVSGILHDVIDDACESLHKVEEEFGDDVAKLVAGVSRLSGVNQLLRRHRRMNLNQCGLGQEEAKNLRVMLLGMVDDPRVVLIKLADRLHNMRTIYALSSPKAQAVAQETLAVWCSLASKLGVWALKSELEDLCFAVLQPQTFRQMHAELASMWNPSNNARNLRRISARANSPASSDQSNEVSLMTDDVTSTKDLLQAVLPFDLLLDRRKRTNFLNNLRSSSKATRSIPRVVTDTSIALASLAVCEELLERELFISTSYVPGMEVTLCSRLKSLYSIYCKMKRKNISIRQVYDARALRVVVGDKNGTLHGDAVGCCYNLLNIVHRLWTPIDGEFDDYIVNPKPSGYQSLHTAVQGPYSSPLEVQIRTQRMHEYAEYGLAAHWLYKEADGSALQDPKTPSSYPPEDESCTEEDEFLKYSLLKAGHPVLRVEGSHLLAAVIVRVDNGGRELLVAVSFGLGASEAVADRRSSFQLKKWEAYACLYKKVSDQWWFAPGHGDWCTCLEKYTLSRDGIYHKQDQFQRLLPTFIQVIDLTEEEAAEYWMIVSAVLEGKSAASIPPKSSYFESSIPNTSSSALVQTRVNNKAKLLRTMLQWEEHVRTEASFDDTQENANCSDYTPLGEIVIVGWPNGEIMRMQTGSTAVDAARRIGLEGRLVLVNGHFSLPDTELKDGDIVEVRV